MHFNYYTDDQNSCKKPAKAQQQQEQQHISIQAPMKATIKCLPPILHTCQNVPAADRATHVNGAPATVTAPAPAPATATKIIKTLSINDKTNINNNNNNNKNNSNNNYNDHLNNTTSCSGYRTSDTVASTTIRGGSCCHHWEHKNYDYEKHKPRRTAAATATTTEGARSMFTIATPSAVAAVVVATTSRHQPKSQEQKGQEKGKRQQNNYNNKNNNVGNTNISKNNNNNKNNYNNSTEQQHAVWCSSRNRNNITKQERCRHFDNLKENTTSLMLSSATSTTSSASSALLALLPLPPSATTLHSRTIAKIAESTTKSQALFANRTSRKLASQQSSSSSSSPPLSSPSSASTSLFWPQCDLQINCEQKMSNAVCYDDKRVTSAATMSSSNSGNNDNRNLWQQNLNGNVCLVDSSLKLRSKQLVMPIVMESRQRHRRHSNSSSSSIRSTNNSYEQHSNHDDDVDVDVDAVELPERQTPQADMMEMARSAQVHHSQAGGMDNSKSIATIGYGAAAAAAADEAKATSATLAFANVSQTTNKQNAFPNECELLLSSRATRFDDGTQRKTTTTKATKTRTTTIAGDIITHDEVKNFNCCFREYSDNDEDDDRYNNGYSCDVDVDAAVDAATIPIGYRNCSSTAATTSASPVTLTFSIKDLERQRQAKHPVRHLPTTSTSISTYPVQFTSRSYAPLLRKSYNDVEYVDNNGKSNIQQRRHGRGQGRGRGGQERGEQQQQLLWQMSLVWCALLALLQAQQRRCWHQVVKMFTTSTSKFLMSTLTLLMLITTANCWAGRQDVPSNCTFPLRWEGSWFLSGYQQSIHIKGSQISYRGRCAASDGNKYLIVDEKGCHRCLVIYEKHENVLQYKESECEGDSMYMHQSNPSAMAMRSVLKPNGGDHRGGAHPNTNGHSRLSSSDQYIMRSNDDMNDYFCKGRETLQNLCDQIPGDALLYSLFRENAAPVKCPLKGPFIFTYNRGHGECKSPVSNIESCTEDSRLLLSFQACPDVQGTESTVEELTCLAAWKDGNSRYLVGLVSHHHATSNEELYRCFVYEKISSLMGGPSMISSKDAEYKLAQSGDATCNGLDSAEVGSRIMTLRKPPVAERCDFPVWFQGPRHWHALMGNAVYNYHTNEGSVHIIKSNGYMETRALCEQINKQTATETMAVVHYTTGCQSGFMCMLFYRRDTHVIEIQTGKQASRLEDACAPDHFDVHKMPYITLLASNPDPQICPMEGLYNLRGAIGPPYLTTRHKRNHNNKAHNVHGHHHFNDGFSGISSSAINAGSSNIDSSDIYGRKRRGSLSFRNSERMEKLSWHANTRGLPIRNRRDAIAKSSTSSMSANLTTAAGKLRQTNDTTSNVDNHGVVDGNSDGERVGHQELSGVRAKHTQIIESTSPITTIVTTPTMMKSITNNATASSSSSSSSSSSPSPTATIALTDLAIVRQRSRRNVPGCITNFKAQRQLWVGCTEPNVIDVRPLCNDEGDEEYYCHGSWTENTTVYIIARHKRTKHGVCISYRPTEGTAAKLVIGDACYRGTDKPPEHHLVANLSVFGKCGETSAAASTNQIHIFSYSIILAVSILATIFSGSWNRLSLSRTTLHMRQQR